jgi:glutaredoxin
MNTRPTPRILGLARRCTLALLLAGMAWPALALYKVVGPDGRVTYTDRPPVDSSARVSTFSAAPVPVVPSSETSLPPELRDATTRYPVTLYVTGECPPCDSAREFLAQRGVPFTEKLVVSVDDMAAMERTLGVRAVPSLTVGTQVLRGLSPTEWTAYLDAAGYPRESRLPADWQQPAATTMVPRPVARSVVPAAAAPAAPTPASPAPAAPSGLRF